MDDSKLGKKKTKHLVPRKRKKEKSEASGRGDFQDRTDYVEISSDLISWFEVNARSFYWRETELTGFQYLVVELLLQKTRAETVESFVRGFFNNYPDAENVVKASLKDLTRILEPLGLSKRRSVHLKKICRSILEDHDGQVPLDKDSLLKLTGVGPYIASAFLCFAGNTRMTVIDSNVVRIASRLFHLPKPSDVRRPGDIATVLEKMLPQTRFREFNFALLDLGATICLPRKPKCQQCPLGKYCEYKAKNKN